jgi:hypothetical protein
VKGVLIGVVFALCAAAPAVGHALGDRPAEPRAPARGSPGTGVVYVPKRITNDMTLRELMAVMGHDGTPYVNGGLACKAYGAQDSDGDLRWAASLCVQRPPAA